MDDYKTMMYNIAMVPVGVGWCCWLATSLGVPFITAFYIAKLDKMQGLSPVGSDAIIWTTIYGPFSIPISVLAAGERTVRFFRS
jgi:hypothetical protein